MLCLHCYWISLMFVIIKRFLKDGACHDISNRIELSDKKGK